MKDKLLKLSVMLQILKDENGQDLIEYALVVALIAFAATAGMGSLANDITNAFIKIGKTEDGRVSKSFRSRGWTDEQKTYFFLVRLGHWISVRTCSKDPACA